MSLEPVHRRSSSSSNIASVCAELARLSIDLNGGGPIIRPGTLLDEYERLAIEAQLSRAVLRRSYSEPSPSRTVVLRPPAPARRGENVGKGEGPSQGEPPPRAQRFWLLEALKRVCCWLGSAWSWHGRKGEQEQPMPQPPAPAATRVCLLDYLR